MNLKNWTLGAFLLFPLIGAYANCTNETEAQVSCSNNLTIVEDSVVQCVWIVNPSDIQQVCTTSVTPGGFILVSDTIQSCYTYYDSLGDSTVYCWDSISTDSVWMSGDTTQVCYPVVTPGDSIYQCSTTPVFDTVVTNVCDTTYAENLVCDTAGTEQDVVVQITQVCDSSNSCTNSIQGSATDPGSGTSLILKLTGGDSISDFTVGFSIVPVSGTNGNYQGITAVEIVLSSELEGVFGSADLTISLNGSDLDGLDPGTVAIYYLNNGSWELVGSTLDTANNTITASVTHFSTYGVFGKPLSVGTEKLPAKPLAFSLKLSPNPIVQNASVNYAITEAGNVKMRVFDARGGLVKELVNVRQAAGFHKVFWGGGNRRGNLVSSGIYFIRLEVGGKVLMRKAIVTR